MKLTTLTSHAVLPVADPVEIAALVTLGSSGVARSTPVDLRFVLDRSGSMNEPSGVGSQSKLGALRASVADSLDLLDVGEDQVSCVAFADAMTRVLDTQVLPSDVERSRMKAAVRKLRSAGSTALADSLDHAIGVASQKPGAARRAVVFTDGHVNAGTDQKTRCLALADGAAEHGVPLAVFAVGVDYDEAFLRDLATRAGLGSYYAHLASVQDLSRALGDEIAQLRSAAESDVTVTFTPAAGVTLLEVTRFVPQQLEVVGVTRGGATDRLAALDARGQRYLLRLRLAGGRAAVHSLFVTEVRCRHGGRDLTARDEAFVELCDDARSAASPDATVLATVVNAAGVRAATQGNLPLAKTLFTHSGNAAMVHQLTVLGSAASANTAGQAGRTLRTIVASQAHLPTLGSTPPAGRTP
ncbi:MAG: VWA domain-containing protein [Deltaproteobacteria bacterium]